MALRCWAVGHPQRCWECPEVSVCGVSPPSDEHGGWAATWQEGWDQGRSPGIALQRQSPSPSDLGEQGLGCAPRKLPSWPVPVVEGSQQDSWALPSAKDSAEGSRRHCCCVVICRCTQGACTEAGAGPLGSLRGPGSLSLPGRWMRLNMAQGSWPQDDPFCLWVVGGQRLTP